MNNASVNSLKTPKINTLLLATYDQVMDAAVRDIVPFLPMVMFEATRKYSQNGTISQAFAQFREMLAEEAGRIFDIGAISSPSAGGLSGKVDEEWLTQYRQQEFHPKEGKGGDDDDSDRETLFVQGVPWLWVNPLEIGRITRAGRQYSDCWTLIYRKSLEEVELLPDSNGREGIRP